MENDSSLKEKTERKMSAEELRHLANNLFEQAYEANSFRHILTQFRKNTEEYKEEMMCSAAFYNIIYHALATSLVLILARIYDRSSDSLSIKDLLRGMRELTEDDLHPEMREKYEFGKKKFQHTLKPVEECFYEQEVIETKIILQAAGVEYSSTTISLSLEDYVRLYQKRYRKLKSNIIDKLIEQRNKIVAHNDAVTNFDFRKVFDQFPVSNQEVELLVDFAIDCTQFAREMLTGIHTIPEYVNINDWEGSLKLVRIGLKYEDAYINELIEDQFREIES